MKFLTIKKGITVGSLVLGVGLEKIPRINEIKTVKKIAKKSKDYGLIEGKKIVREALQDIDKEFADAVSNDFVDIVDGIINNSENENINSDSKNNQNIKVTFIDDEKDDDILLLPCHKE